MEEKNEDVSLTRPVVNNYYGIAEEPEDEESSVSLSSIWHMIIKHWVSVVICIFIGLAAGVIFGTTIKSPKYVAKSQITVLKAETSETDNSYLSLMQGKAQATVPLMSSIEVRTAVCNKLAASYPEYDLTNANKKDGIIEGLLDQYEVSQDSIIITVTATTKKKEQSIALANAIVEVTEEFSQDSTNKMSTLLKDCIYVTNTDTATDTSTSNVTIAIIGVIGGLVVGIIYAIVRELTNVRVTSKHEVEQLTGVKVIGMIPKYGLDKDDSEDEEDE